MHVSYFLWGIIFQTKLSKLIKLRKFLLFFFYISILQALLRYIFFFFQQIDKRGCHFHNMLKVFSFSQIVFFTLLSFFTYSLFSHFFLLISFYPYIGLCHSILFYFILYIFFHFFCFVPLNNPTKPNFFLKQLNLWLI